VTDNRVLWDRDAQDAQAVFGEAINTHRASIGLSPVDNVRDHVFTDQPWLATDPVLAPWQQPADLDVVQTGAWVLPDERPLPAELVAFLDAGTPPVYVGFGSVPMRDPEGVARAVIKAIRAQGRRRAPRRRGHHHDGHLGRHASGRGTPRGGPAIFRRPGGCPGHRRGT
jgi:vancomycin aglycone glucosyltransferase